MTGAVVGADVVVGVGVLVGVGVGVVVGVVVGVGRAAGVVVVERTWAAGRGVSPLNAAAVPQAALSTATTATAGKSFLAVLVMTVVSP